MKNFFIRVVSSIVYASLIILGILYSYTFLVVFSTINFLCLHEFYKLVNIKQKTSIHYFHCFGGVLLFISTYLHVSNIFHSHYIFLFYLFYIVFVFVSELYKRHQDPIVHIAFIIFGQCYIALPLSLLNIIAFTSSTYSYTLLLALFIFIWINDSFSYVIGINFGKHQLFKRISPKKSWEGWSGGIIFTLVTSFVFAYYISNIPLYHWMGIAIVVSIFSTWGDLIESLIKRTWRIKDSGLTIPGHGGFLDRFDSLFFATYALVFYMKWFI